MPDQSAPEHATLVSEGHHAAGIGIAVGRKLLHGDLGLGSLAAPAVRHQDGRAAYGGVEHLHEALL